MPSEEHAKRRGPGRNLPAAIAVGVGLGAVLIVAVFVLPQAFPVVAAVAMVLAVLIGGQGAYRGTILPLQADFYDETSPGRVAAEATRLLGHVEPRGRPREVPPTTRTARRLLVAAGRRHAPRIHGRGDRRRGVLR